MPADYTEVNLDVGELLILDPMLMHSASSNTGEILSSRHVVFTTMFADSAIGTTLAALPNRMAVAPASKFAPELREGLPEGLRGLLEWELPLAGQTARAVPNGLAVGAQKAKL